MSAQDSDPAKAAAPAPATNNSAPEPTSAPAPINMELPEEKKSTGLFDIGLADGAAGVVAGGAAGLGVDYGVVTSSVKKNLAEPYAKALKAHGETVSTANLFTDLREFLPAADVPHLADIVGTDLGSATEANLTAGAEGVYWKAKHVTQDAVKASASGTDAAQPVKDLFTDGTLLGKARAKAHTNHAPDFKNERDEVEAFRKNWATKAKQVAEIADPAAKKTAAEDLIKTVLADAEKSDAARITEKVKEISIFRKLNPFGELHLTGGQKGMAIAAGTATAAVGFLGISWAVRKLFGGAEKSTGGRE